MSMTEKSKQHTYTTMDREISKQQNMSHVEQAETRVSNKYVHDRERSN